MQTVDFVRNNKILHAHIFPYSRREGTPAASDPAQLSTNEKKQRCAFLTEAANEAKKAVFTEHIGKSVTVLVENNKDGYWFGHTESFMPVAIREDCRPGEFKQVVLSNIFQKISDELSIII
jgi:threonylcarbamoyladenosine tRNA methylthiotransferase MtaB